MKLERTAEEEDASSVIEKVSKAPGGGFDGLDFGVHSLGKAVGDRMKNEVKQVG